MSNTNIISYLITYCLVCSIIAVTTTALALIVHAQCVKDRERLHDNFSAQIQGLIGEQIKLGSEMTEIHGMVIHLVGKSKTNINTIVE